MPATAISANLLPDGLAALALEMSVSAPVQTQDNASSSGFLALLNVASAQPDIAQEGSSGGNQPQANNNPPPPPADISAPPPASNASATSNASQPGATDDAGNTANNTENNSTNGTNNTAGNTQSQAEGQSTDQSSQPSTQTAAANAGQNSGSTGIGALTPGDDTVRDGLRRQLDAINQILMSMLQAMMSVPAPVVMDPTAAPQVTTDATAAAGQPAATLPSDTISLLQDMQSLIQQLQQALQPADGQAADATDQLTDTTGQTQASTTASGTANSGSTLQQIIDALQTDNATLAQMLQQKTTANTSSTSPTTSLFNVSSSSVPVDNSALLASIAQVRSQLQQLQTANDVQFAQAQANFQAQFAQTLSTLSKTADTSSASDAAPAANTNNSVATSNTVAPATPSISVPSAANNLVAAIAAAPVIMGQGSADSSAGDNGGSSQNQPAPLPAIASTGQSAPTSTVSTISFARVLSQASAPASLLDQVTFNIKTALTDGSSKIHIQLEPADLGKLDIQLNVSADGKTGVAITADNKNTLALLQRDTAGLTRALSDAGLSTDAGSLSFSLNGGQQNFAQGQPTSQAAATYQSAQPEEDLSIPVVSQSYVVNLTQGLDITI